eukprot:5414121-Pyramimonas_sp.AAC.1
MAPPRQHRPRRSWILVLLWSRGVYIVIEQPLNSGLYSVPELRQALDMIGAKRIVIHAGEFGATSMKPLELFATLPLTALEHLRTNYQRARARVEAFWGGKHN